MRSAGARLEAALASARQAAGPVVVLTGAGISKESGIPTFRGAEGFWTVGSKHYRPEELATLAAFRAMPEAIWGWYLYRLALCRDARPNAAHHALVRFEKALTTRFTLITQNVDGLHLAAGQSAERTYQIHGNIRFMRCLSECNPALQPVPEDLAHGWQGERALQPAEMRLLTCPACGAPMRPHVLWFDECYDEERYRYESSLRAARAASLLLVIGTSGATALPMQVVTLVAQRGAPVIVVDPSPEAFAETITSSPLGALVQGEAGAQVPRLVEALLAPTD